MYFTLIHRFSEIPIRIQRIFFVVELDGLIVKYTWKSERALEGEQNRKINSRWMKDLNVKEIKLRSLSLYENVFVTLGVRKAFLKQTHKRSRNHKDKH